MGDRPIASASLLENVRLNALVFVPNAVQGIFRRRPKAVAAATAANTDGLALRLLTGMRRRHDGRAVRIRIVRDPAILVFSRDDVRQVLAGAPEPYAADPEAKRKGMAAFQPQALTISRGDEWRARRRFAESVLGAEQSGAGLSDPFREVVADEVAALESRLHREHGAELEWGDWNELVWRITRRVILGERAAGDRALTEVLWELMEEANGMPDEPSGRSEELESRIGAYLAEPEEGSLAWVASDTELDAPGSRAGQLVHWLFAMGDTLAVNSFRALALLCAHPGQREAFLAADGDGAHQAGFRNACLSEAMRLWPTTPILSRVTTGETELAGERLEAGTQIVISNLANHRDPELVPFADRFAPEEWVEGGAAEDWAFNHFSHGPQGCPGATLSLDVGSELLARALDVGQWRLASPKLDPAKPMPRMLNPFALSFER